MSFTKSEMQEELSKFLTLYGAQVERLYGSSDSARITTNSVEESVVWKAASDMYDYGIAGIPNGILVPGSIIDGIHAHVEKFLRAIDTPAMRVYLNENDNSPPSLAVRAVQSAVARMVLDGGERNTDFGTDVHGIGKGDWGYLTLAEVALLANMDERSVRNAANPKLPDPLKTEPVGRRSLVRPEEARRWLAGRKGFIPTQANDNDVVHRPPSYNLELPQEIVDQIKKEALERGEPFTVYFEKRFIELAMKVLKNGDPK